MVVNGVSYFVFQWQKAEINEGVVSKLNDRQDVLVWRKPETGCSSCLIEMAKAL